MELLIQSFDAPKGVKWCNKKFKEVLLFVHNNCDGSDCYPLGMNFEDAVTELHVLGMRFNRWR